MVSKVKIEDIIEGIELNSFDNLALLHIPTGEVITILREFLVEAEEDEPFNHLPDWQQEEMERAIDILEHEDNYLSLPTEFDIDEYSMIEDFCYEVKDQRKQEILLRAIRGKGAFRRFKDQIYTLDLEQDWYSYRDERYKQLAIEFCERYNLEYTK